MTGQRYKDELVTGEVNAASHYGPRAIESALPSEFVQSGGQYTIMVPFNAEGAPYDLLALDQASILLPDFSYIESVHMNTNETFDDLLGQYDIGTATIDGVDAVQSGLIVGALPETQGTHVIGNGADVGSTLEATNPGTAWQVTITLIAGSPLIGSANIYVTYSRGVNDRAQNFDAIV